MTTEPAVATLSDRLLGPRQYKLRALTGQPLVLAFAEGTISDGTIIRWAQTEAHFSRRKLRALYRLLSKATDERLARVIGKLAGDCQSEPGMFRDLLTTLGALPSPKPPLTCTGYGSYFIDCADLDLFLGVVALLVAEQAHQAVIPFLEPSIRAAAPRGQLTGHWSGDEHSETVAELRACVDDFGTPPAHMMAAAGEVADTMLDFARQFGQAIWDGEGWPL